MVWYGLTATIGTGGVLGLDEEMLPFQQCGLWLFLTVSAKSICAAVPVHSMQRRYTGYLFEERKSKMK